MMEIKTQLRKLWDLCFNETQVFSDLYFEMRDIEQSSIYIKHNQHIVSAMQLLPYSLTFHGTSFDTAYISGACTHPDFRKQGLMHNLIINAFKRLYRQHTPIVTLIPANRNLFDYYSKFGFVANFNYALQQIESQEYNIDNIVECQYFEIEEAYSYFSSRLSERNYCIQHSFKDFKMIIKDMESGGIQPLIAMREGKIAGMAFPYHMDGKTIIKELLYDDESVRCWLLSHLSLASLIIPGNKQQLGMMRVIALFPILEKYAQIHPEINTEFHLKDVLVPENSGDYAIGNGKVTQRSGKRHEEIDITTIAEAIFGDEAFIFPKPLQGFKPLSPYMSLMLD